MVLGRSEITLIFYQKSQSTFEMIFFKLEFILNYINEYAYASDDYYDDMTSPS